MTTHTHQHGPEFSSNANSSSANSSSANSSGTSEERKAKRAGFLDRQRASGFGVGLYRNIEDGKLAGVCAGVADYVEVDRGMLRLIFLASLLFSGGLAVMIYLGAWLILAPAQTLPTTDGETLDPSLSAHQETQDSTGER